jgi:cobalamin biosynthesis Co2+ chelatase CbiK
MFENSGLFTAVECQIEGLGRIQEVQEIYSAHAAEAIGE